MICPVNVAKYQLLEQGSVCIAVISSLQELIIQQIYVLQYYLQTFQGVFEDSKNM